MLKNFKNGWLTFEFEIGDTYTCKASYLEDTPQDLLDACIEYLKKGKPSLVTLNEEDNGCTYIIIDCTIRVVKDDNVFPLEQYNLWYITDFVEELIDDIEENLDTLVKEFYLMDNPRKIKRQLSKKIKLLKRLILMY